MGTHAQPSDFDDLLGADQSPLDMPIDATFFPDVYARRAEYKLISLRELSSRLATPRAPEKKQLPMLKLGKFGNLPSDVGSLKHGPNMLSVHGIEIDYDDMDGRHLTLADAIGRCEAAGIAALGYTSPSHTPESPHWRLLAPLSRPVPPDERTRFWRAI